MKCLVCESLSFYVICNLCQSTYLKPSIKKQEIITNFFTYSFYDYEDIKEFIYTKYQPIGSKIYYILAKNSFKLFAKEFNTKHKIHSISIDDDTSKGYSHSAILNRALKTKNIKPLHNKIKATNNIKFANKDYSFRLQNPRNFIYKKSLIATQQVKDVILVDDIITSGLTILEAKDTLTRQNINTLFALTLCNLQKD